MDVANFVTLIAENSIRLVIEIGFLQGGMASMMISRIAYDPTFRYLGVDIQNIINPQLKAQIDKLPNEIAQIVIGDCFGAPFTKKASGWIVTTVGPALVFCDGGNKPKEINHFAHLVRVGDYILAHDYHPDHATENNPQWSDIKPHIDSGEFVVASPEHWPETSLFLIRRVK
jgi:hypothetical protein